MRLAILTHDQRRRCALALAGLAAASAIGGLFTTHAAPIDDRLVPVILSIKGESGDQTYDTYRSSYGIPHGCTTINVVDNDNDPVSSSIYTRESCDLTPLDVDNVGEVLSESLLSVTPRYDIHLPIVAR